MSHEKNGKNCEKMESEAGYWDRVQGDLGRQRGDCAKERRGKEVRWGIGYETSIPRRQKSA